MSKYTEPKIYKGPVRKRIPDGSSLEKELLKNSWCISYTYDGKQYRVKKGINRIKDFNSRLKKANVVLLSVKKALENGVNPADRESLRKARAKDNIQLNEAVVEYMNELREYARPKTVISYLSKLRYLVEEFPSREVKSITSFEIQNYILKKIKSNEKGRLFIHGKMVQMKQPKPWTQNTVRSAKGVFRAFFQWCIHKGIYKESNPVSKIESRKIRSEVAAKPRHTAFSEKDINEIMTYLDKTDKGLAFYCRVIFTTCLRPGELSQIRLRDIDFTTRRIIVPLSVTKNTKKHTVDRIDIVPQLFEWINNLQPQQYDKDCFLTSVEDGIIGRKPLNSNVAYKRFAKALKRLGLEGKGYTLYSFKHYANTKRYSAGWTPVEIKVGNRHSSISMTENYLRDLGVDIDLRDKSVPII